MGKTLYQKLYDAHIVRKIDHKTSLLYIDRHLIHEVTSPQAFNNLRIKRRNVRQPNKTFATMDHNVPTHSRNINDCNNIARIQMNTLIKNCTEFKIKLYDLMHPYQGIIHVVAPEKGITLPGMTIVCGDSHTSTHGAFGSLAFGIGTTEVEHVLATQTLKQSIAKTMKINIHGNLSPFVTAKDMIMAIIGKLGTAGATGYVVEFSGNQISKFSMESRMTVCNMAIEMGAKSGIIAPDEITYNYIRNKRFSPKHEQWDKAIQYWNTLKSDDNAIFDKIVSFDASIVEPQVTWGTNPAQVISINEVIPSPKSFTNIIEQQNAIRALKYMNLPYNISLSSVTINKVFIGSCTNSRIEDLRAAAMVVRNKHIAYNVQAIVVPGSGMVKKQAENEGLSEVFLKAGFEWRFSGCSMCLGMNDDQLYPNERCASTSNRNFENRQGRGSYTHLVSPMMAAAAALTGHFTDVRKLLSINGKSYG